MDKLLPRGVHESLTTIATMTITVIPSTPLPLRYFRISSAAFASFNLLRLSPLCTLYTTTDFFLYSFVKAPDSFSTSIMEKNTQEEAKKDQQRGRHDGQATGDYSNRGANDILPNILNLYGSRASPQDFEIYAPNATFEDPLMRAEGVKQIKSAFYSIGKVFSESRIVEYSIKEDVISPGKKEINIDSKQYYKFLGKEIHMVSLINLQMENGKIVHHEDRWDKKPLRNRETVKLPLVGRMIETARRASMLATHALMGFGKDPTN